MSKIALLAVPLVALSVCAAHPGLCAALGLDVWNLPELRSRVEAERTEERELTAEDDDVRQRIAAKETVIADLIAGRIGLDAATERFAEMNAGRAHCLDAIRATYPGDTDEEKMARNVIAYCETRVPAAERDELTARLEAELHQMLCEAH